MDPTTNPTNTSNVPNPPNPADEPEIINPTVVNPTSAPLQPAAPVQPTVGAEPVQATGIFVGGTGSEPLAPKKHNLKLPVIILTALTLLGGASAAYYFGYYTSSSYVYRQSLENTGQGLSELSEKFSAKELADYKGYSGNGDYKITSSSFNTDGKITFKTDKANSETTFDVGLGVTRLDFTVRSIKSASINPDIYFKAEGLSGLSSVVGPEFGAIADKYNDQWIVVDHTLLDNAQKQAAGGSTATAPTAEQVISAVDAFSKVNEAYVFTTDEDKAVTKVLESYGKKEVDGRSVMHYKVGFDTANVKEYITAQNAALKSSKLNDWIKSNEYSEELEKSYKELLKSADEIKATDSFDLYADVKNRVIYKIRVSETKNPAANFVDIGMDYQGDNNLPFFVAGKSAEDKLDFKLTVNANTDTNVMTAKLVATSTGDDKMEVSSNFTFKPSATAPAIEKPASAKQIAEVFQELGFGDPFSAVGSVGETLGVSTGFKKP